MSIGLGPSFRSFVTAEVTELFLEALRRAYETLVARHDPAVGCNAFTSGFDLFNFVGFELAQSLAELSDAGIELRIKSALPGFALQLGPYEVRSYRVADQFQDIRTSMPRNEGAAARLAPEQFLPGFEPLAVHPQGLILAHMGNEIDGLLAAYVCVPQEQRDGKIVRWADWEALLEPEQIVLEPTEDVALAQEEVIEEPTVRRRKPAQQEEQGDE